MKAVLVSEPGGPEKLELVDVPDPAPGTAEVAIEIHATALNRADLLQRRGLYPPPPGTTDILGLECAGVVSELGPGCSDSVRLGERVMVLLGGGGYAERVVVPEALLMKVPQALSLELAAAIPEAFLTAREALFAAGRLGSTESVLIHAAAGGVGSAAVQLAHAHGARVFATAGGAAK
ncbi:MAG TPA: alcohol dehydrogenase catalytic domain-containing protein, partial [Polyangiaceae bacterium]